MGPFFKALPLASVWPVFLVSLSTRSSDHRSVVLRRMGRPTEPNSEMLRKTAKKMRYLHGYDIKIAKRLDYDIDIYRPRICVKTAIPLRKPRYKRVTLLSLLKGTILENWAARRIDAECDRIEGRGRT